jgi:Cu2+-exporting ATPase
MPRCCFHCGELIPKGIDLHVVIDKKSQPMCCIGCEAVANAIVDNSLTQYYKFRTQTAQKGTSLVPQQLEASQLKRNQLLDDESIQDEFTYKTDLYKETILSIDGISCAACAWLIEMQLSKVSGIINVSVNATTQRATIRWQEDLLKLSEIIAHIAQIGYQALPFKASSAEEKNKQQSKAFIKRLGISGILMMQVMMIAVGLYFGAFSGMAEHNLIYLRWVSFFLTLPIVLYGAMPFYQGAYRTLKLKRLSMDVPVSIAISLAFSASAWATFTQQGEVYFESVSMFTFLLLIGKFLEFRARSRAAEVSANLLKLMPMTATKIVDNKEELIAAKKLQLNDIVLIKAGELVPADGLILSGQSQLNEAMLSGEQRPITKTVGDKVFAGTVNGDSNLNIQVQKTTSNSFLSQLIRLSEASQAHKPKLAQLSDKIAQYFVALILLCAIITALYWHQHLPEEAFWITLSVLVATCPCALSLATPTALTCATTRLNSDGIMIKASHVLETLPKINNIAFDKTGTLTTGEFAITKVVLLNDNVASPSISKQDVLTWAAALESHSEHPLAKAFNHYRDFTVNAEKVTVHPGKGVSALIAGFSFEIGKVSWLLSKKTAENITADTSQTNKQIQNAQCVLMRNQQAIAIFYLEDKIRDDAAPLFKQLQIKHIRTLMLSGDNQAGCEKVSAKLPLNEVHCQLSAEDKVNIIKNKQADKKQYIAMIGDGVNDTPVFGAAHISIAMGNGTDVAKSGADVILLNNKLSTVSTLINVAKKNRKIIIQNYSWAFAYNALVLPLAMTGFITPYMAVIGMSASSIIVITNSLRLLKK